MSDSDHYSLTVDDRHAQNTPDGLPPAFYHVFLQPRGDVTDVEDLARRCDVSRDLPQRTRQVVRARSIDPGFLLLVVHLEDHSKFVAVQRRLREKRE